jgi:hypothetical protein
MPTASAQPPPISCPDKSINCSGTTESGNRKCNFAASNSHVKDILDTSIYIL